MLQTHGVFNLVATLCETRLLEPIISSIWASNSVNGMFYSMTICSLAIANYVYSLRFYWFYFPEVLHDWLHYCIGTLPTGADYLLAYSTIPGYVSWRNNQKGTYFISALSEVFIEMCDKEHLLDMLTEVNRRVAVDFESSEKTGRKKQMPQPVSTLLKKLYFNREK